MKFAQSYLLGELTKLAERPTMAEIVARNQARARATGLHRHYVRRRCRGARRTGPARDVSEHVLDASVAVTALTEPGSGAADLLADTDAAFQAPSIFDVEVISALLGLVRGGKYDRSNLAHRRAHHCRTRDPLRDPHHQMTAT
jgi:hypothetical protein